MTKSEIFKAAHAQAARDRKQSKRETYAQCLGAALKTAWWSFKQDLRLAEVRKVKALELQKEVDTLKNTQGFNGKIYGSANNFYYFVSNKRYNVSNAFVEIFNAAPAVVAARNTNSDSSSSSKNFAFTQRSGFIRTNGEDWGYGDGDDN